MKREPALWIAVLTAILTALVTFGVPGLTPDLSTAIVAVVAAAGGIWTAIRTRPIAPGLFSGLITSLAVLAAGLGLDFAPEQVAAVQLVFTTILTLIARGQIEPVLDPNAAHTLRR